MTGVPPTMHTFYVYTPLSLIHFQHLAFIVASSWRVNPPLMFIHFWPKVNHPSPLMFIHYEKCRNHPPYLWSSCTRGCFLDGRNYRATLIGSNLIRKACNPMWAKSWASKCPAFVNINHRCSVEHVLAYTVELVRGSCVIHPAENRLLYAPCREYMLAFASTKSRR